MFDRFEVTRRQRVISQYRAAIALFRNSYHTGKNCDWADPALMKLGDLLLSQTRTSVVSEGDYSSMSNLTKELNHWVKDYELQYDPFMKKVKSDILSIISYHQSRLIKVMNESSVVQWYDRVVQTEAPIHNWQNRLERLTPESVTRKEADLIDQMAQLFNEKGV